MLNYKGKHICFPLYITHEAIDKQPDK
jgi:hypothetical protein